MVWVFLNLVTNNYGRDGDVEIYYLKKLWGIIMNKEMYWGRNMIGHKKRGGTGINVKYRTKLIMLAF